MDAVMTWFDHGRWAVWDTETTAPQPTEARLVTACVAFVGGGQPTEVRSWVVDAGVDIPAEAAEIHGYDTARVRAEGKPIVDVLPEIVGCLANAVVAGLPLIAYNAVYDNTVLNCETARAGMDPFADVLTNAIVFDPLTIDRHVDRYRPGKRTLTDACAHYQVELGTAHDSTFDALAAGRVLYRIGQRTQMGAAALRGLYADRRYPDNVVRGFHALGRYDAAELHAAQVGWYAEQSAGLGAYWMREAATFRAEADHDDTTPDRRDIALHEAAELVARVATLRTDWPVQPVPEGATL
jgi:DNA polymerase-3 subunit epsilon